MADQETVKCSGCGMEISPEAADSTVEKDGETLYYCSAGCAAGASSM